MGNLAQMASHLGHDVAGVDQKVYPPMSDELAKSGISFKEGYTEENFQDADIYILGNVISKDNPLLIKILSHGKNIMSGPEWLYENVLKDKKVIAVSGTHGKTTVTTMIAHALLEQGENPGYLIAGVPKMLKKSWNISDSKFFVIEADEYDTSCFDKEPKFFHYRPHTLLINNIEFDHADIFNNIDDIKKQFHHLLKIVPKSGNLIYFDDDQNTSDVIKSGLWCNKVIIGSDHIEIDILHRALIVDNKKYSFDRDQILNSLTSKDINDAFNSISKWEGYSPTPLVKLNKLSKELNLKNIFYKDENKRFNLKSFKALGGAYAVEKVTKGNKEIVVATATAGNHGRSVAWGAKRLGLKCKIFISEFVSDARGKAMEALGAEVIKVKGNYENSLIECIKQSTENNWQIVQDVAWKDYMLVPKYTMAGYSVMMKE